MSVHAYHPGTGADAVLTTEQLDHMRLAGWMLRSEYDEQQAAQAAAAAPAEAKPSESKGK